MIITKLKTHLNRSLLRNIRHYSNCPRETMKVTILGPSQPIGGTIALLLKQCKQIDEICLYGENNSVCGTAVDLSHIDTNTRIKAYSGDSKLLQASLKGAKIVVICGEGALESDEREKDVFYKNVDAVRKFSLHVAEYNPQAILLLSAPPINSLIPLISEEFKRAGHYDPRKIIGLSNVSSIRANSIIGKRYNLDPNHVLCPVVGGACPDSIVPVLSQATPKMRIPDKDIDDLVEEICYAEKKALESKYKQHLGDCYLSRSFAASRFVTSLIRAIKGDKNCFECAYIRQTGHISNFLPYMTSMVRLGPFGVDHSYMPKLNTHECNLLQKAYPHIRNDIQVGTSVVTGEVFKFSNSEACRTVFNPRANVIGDVVVDLSKKYRRFQIYQ